MLDAHTYICVCVFAYIYMCVCVSVCMYLLFICSVMSDSFATPWTIAHQAPLPMEIFQARVLKWVAISSSRRSSYPRDRT